MTDEVPPLKRARLAVVQPPADHSVSVWARIWDGFAAPFRRRDMVQAIAIGATTPFTAVSESSGVRSANCPICLTPAQSPLVLVPCGHVVCAECGLQWIAQRPSCTECRAPIHNAIRCPLLESCLGAPFVDKTIMSEWRERVSLDSNIIPIKYQGHLVRRLGFKAIRHGDKSTLEACLLRHRLRASARLLIAVVGRTSTGHQCDFEFESQAVRLLIAHGARVNGQVAGHRPLHFVVCSGNVGCAEILLDARADPNLHGGPDRSKRCLDLAPIKPQMRDLLLKHGAMSSTECPASAELSDGDASSCSSSTTDEDEVDEEEETESE